MGHNKEKRRRESIRSLVQQDLFDSEDKNFKKKIARMEAVLTLNFGAG